jgi:arylformamidase
VPDTPGRRRTGNRYSFEGALDLTHTLENGMPVYPGDPSPSFERYATIEKEGVNLTRLVLGSHTGTHIDAPKHFIQGGEGIDRIPPSSFVGEAFAIDVSYREVGSAVTREDVERHSALIRRGDAVLLYTGCSEMWGDESVLRNYTHLSSESAEYLVSLGARCVGIDFLSVEAFNARDPVVHRTLLSSGVYIIESLSSSLKRLTGRRFLLISLPLKLKDGDGAPCRAVALPEE